MSVELTSLSNKITVTADNNIGISAPGVGSFSLTDQQLIIYVSKSGSDTNSGLNINESMLTIAGAMASAVALTPSVSNQITVQILDTGTYTESFTQSEFVHIDGQNAAVDGEIDLEDNCILRLRRLAHTAGNGSCVSKINGSGLSKVIADLMVISSSTNEGIFLKNGQLGVTVGTVLCNAGSSFIVRAGSTLVFDVQYMNLSNSGRGFLTSTTGGTGNVINGNILLVDDDGTGRFIRTVVTGDVVDIQGGSFMVNSLYDMGLNSSLNIFAHKTTGTRLAVATAQINIIDTSGDSHVQGVIFRDVQSISATTVTQAKGDSLHVLDTSSNDITDNLLAAALWTGQTLNIKKTSSLNKIIINPDGSELIEGAATFEFFNDNESITIISDGTGIHIV